MALSFFLIFLTFISSLAIPTFSAESNKDHNTDSAIAIMMLKDPGAAIIWLSICLSIICMITVAARFWIRTKKGVLAADDYCMAAGLMCYILDNGFACNAVRAGLGRPNYVVDYSVSLDAIKWLTVWSMTFAISTVPVRASVALAILKLTSSRSYKRAVWVLISCIVLAAIVQVVWIAQSCEPLVYLWDSTDQQGRCKPIDITVGSIWMFAIASIIIDLFLAVLPSILVYKLRLSKWRKLQTYLFLTSGLFATGATVGRLFYIEGYRDVGYWSENFYFELSGVILASQLEIGFGIFCPSLGIVNQFRDHFAEQVRYQPVNTREPGKAKKPTKFFGISSEVSTGHRLPSTFEKIKNLITKGRLEDEYVPLPGNENCILVETTVEVTTDWDFDKSYGYADGRPVDAEEDGDLNHLFAAGASSRLSYELQKLPAGPTRRNLDNSDTTTAESSSVGPSRKQRKQRNTLKKRARK